MNFKEYQEKVVQMPLYDDTLLGLVGELGEVVELVKKDRRKGTYRKIMNKEDLTKELGDILWYLARFASENFINLDDIATVNIRKLNERHGIKE